MSKWSAQILIAAVVSLLGVGVIMLVSTSVFGIDVPSEDVYYDVKRQVVWLVLGGLVCTLMASIDYHLLQKLVWLIYGACLVLLAMCFVPGIGHTLNGESRWIGIGGFNFQPSELAKLTIAIVMAHWFSTHFDESKPITRGFLVPGVIAGVIAALVLFEVDLGTTVILSAVVFILMFVGGTNWKYLTLSCVLVGGAFAMMMVQRADKMERLTAFLHPDLHRSGVGLQQYMALMALGSGGVEGMGLGSGRLKMLYMPFAHTDFIFPMIGEELGLRVTLAVVFAFLLITVAGLMIAFHARDRFGTLLGVGVVSFISLQAVLNIGVTTSILPNTGLPLPFISYGGSALMTVMAGIGILLNIFRQGDISGKEGFKGLSKRRITARI
ncbi:MAG: putative lipid II flippase FtsW [Verrucomicrobiales bacterium]|nr:putative lipid II flippase FtsW [Verrucomicrobiales bacterium]